MIGVKLRVPFGHGFLPLREGYRKKHIVSPAKPLGTHSEASLMKSHEQIAKETKERFGLFLKNKINPGSLERDRTNTTFAPELLEEAAKIGLVGFTAPKEVGGGGHGWYEWGNVLEEIGYLCTDAGLPMLLSYRESAANLVYRSKRTDLIERYVRPAVQGKSFIGWSYSEGTDPFSFETTIRKVNGDYVLNGEKLAITGGLGDDVFITYGVNEDGNDLIAVMVERTDPGVELTPVATMGLRSIGIARLKLDQVKVPGDRVLVPSDGVSHAQIFINERRITGASWVLGKMRALLESIIEHLSHRIRYERPLTEMQTIQAAIGRMSVAIESSRLMVHSMLERVGNEDLDYLWDPNVAMAKYFLIEQAVGMAQTAQQLLGGYGYMQEFEFDRYLRDFYGVVPIIGTQYTLEVDLGIRAIQQLDTTFVE